jgi:hypothetical protein
LRNLHARLLITNTFAAWRNEYRRRDKLERMVGCTQQRRARALLPCVRRFSHSCF